MQTIKINRLNRRLILVFVLLLLNLITILIFINYNNIIKANDTEDSMSIFKVNGSWISDDKYLDNDKQISYRAEKIKYEDFDNKESIKEIEQYLFVPFVYDLDYTNFYTTSNFFCGFENEEDSIFNYNFVNNNKERKKDENGFFTFKKNETRNILYLSDGQILEGDEAELYFKNHIKYEFYDGDMVSYFESRHGWINHDENFFRIITPGKWIKIKYDFSDNPIIFPDKNENNDWEIVFYYPVIKYSDSDGVISCYYYDKTDAAIAGWAFLPDNNGLQHGVDFVYEGCPTEPIENIIPKGTNFDGENNILRKNEMRSFWEDYLCEDFVVDLNDLNNNGKILEWIPGYKEQRFNRFASIQNEFFNITAETDNSFNVFQKDKLSVKAGGNYSYRLRADLLEPTTYFEFTTYLENNEEWQGTFQSVDTAKFLEQQSMFLDIEGLIKYRFNLNANPNNFPSNYNYSYTGWHLTNYLFLPFKVYGSTSTESEENIVNTDSVVFNLEKLEQDKLKELVKKYTSNANTENISSTQYRELYTKYGLTSITKNGTLYSKTFSTNNAEADELLWKKYLKNNVSDDYLNDDWFLMDYSLDWIWTAPEGINNEDIKAVSLVYDGAVFVKDLQREIDLSYNVCSVLYALTFYSMPDDDFVTCSNCNHIIKFSDAYGYLNREHSTFRIQHTSENEQFYPFDDCIIKNANGDNPTVTCPYCREDTDIKNIIDKVKTTTNLKLVDNDYFYLTIYNFPRNEQEGIAAFVKNFYAFAYINMKVPNDHSLENKKTNNTLYINTDTHLNPFVVDNCAEITIMPNTDTAYLKLIDKYSGVEIDQGEFEIYDKDTNQKVLTDSVSDGSDGRLGLTPVQNYDYGKYFYVQTKIKEGYKNYNYNGAFNINMFTQQNQEVNEIEIANDRLSTNVNFKFVDKTDYEKGVITPITNAKFILYSNEDENLNYPKDTSLEQEIKPDEDGCFNLDLRWSNYYLKLTEDTSIQKGYTIQTKIPFNITSANCINNDLGTIYILFDRILGDISLSITDEDGELISYPTNEFELYYKEKGSDNYSKYKDVYTTENGILTITNLPWGEYYLIQTKASNNYLKNNDKIEFEINENIVGTTINLTTINKKNTAPTVTINDIPTVHYPVKEGKKEITITGNFNDIDNTECSVLIKINNGKNLSAAVNSNGTWSIIINPMEMGLIPNTDIIVSAIANDGQADSMQAQTTFQLTNEKPVIMINDILNLKYNINGEKITLTGEVSDADNDVCAVKVKVNSNEYKNATVYTDGSWKYEFNSKEYNIQPNINTKIEVVANDGVVNSDIKESYIILKNSTPILNVNKVDDVQFKETNAETLIVSGTVTDSDNDKCTVFIKFNDTNIIETAVIDGKWSVLFDINNLNVGEYSMLITAVDTNNFSSEEKEVNFNVLNTPPTININNIITQKVDVANIELDIEDINIGQEINLSYSIDNQPRVSLSNLSYKNDKKKYINIKLDILKSLTVGEHQLTIFVSDGINESSLSKTFIIYDPLSENSIWNENTPVLNIISEQKTVRKGRPLLIKFSIEDLDVNDQLTIYRSINNQAFEEIDSFISNGSQEEKEDVITDLMPGEYNITYKVVDKANHSVEKSFDFKVLRKYEFIDNEDTDNINDTDEIYEVDENGNYIPIVRIISYSNEILANKDFDIEVSIFDKDIDQNLKLYYQINNDIPVFVTTLISDNEPVSKNINIPGLSEGKNIIKIFVVDEFECKSKLIKKSLFNFKNNYNEIEIDVINRFTNNISLENTTTTNYNYPENNNIYNNNNNSNKNTITTAENDNTYVTFVTTGVESNKKISGINILFIVIGFILLITVFILSNKNKK